MFERDLEGGEIAWAYGTNLGVVLHTARGRLAFDFIAVAPGVPAKRQMRHDTGGLHAGKGADRRHCVAIITDHRSCIGIAVLHENGIGDDDVLGTETGIGMDEGDEAAQHQRAPDEQHTGECHFREDEGPAGSFRPGAAARASCTLQCVLQIRARRGERGTEAKQDSRKRGNEENEGERPAVDLRVQEFLDVVGREMLQGLESPHGDRDPQRAADAGEHRCFREQLRDQAPPARAHRAANRHFRLPRTRPGQHQVGDICARNEEEEGDGTK